VEKRRMFRIVHNFLSAQFIYRIAFYLTPELGFTPAPKTGAYYRTSAGPIAIPVASLVAQRSTGESRATKNHGAGVWFPEPLTEMTVLSEQYDFAISLLLLSNDPPPFEERLRGVGGLPSS
jgi:hypothetical protein